MHIPPLPVLLAIGIILFVAIGLHEYAHCKVADMFGDPTPGSFGRVTLNLTKHFEPTGVFMMVFTTLSGYGVGWGKPAPVDMRKMRNPRWDGFLTVAAGPICNLLQATVFAIVIRSLVLARVDFGPDSWFTLLLYVGVVLNVRLALFNLIPFGLLDGHWLVGLLMPEKPRYYWFKFNRSYGIVMILGVILVSQYMESNGHKSPLTYFIDVPGSYIERFLLGAPK